MPKERKKRRSGKDLEDIIIDATTKCIKENGFHGVTLTGIAKTADIEPPVLYKRYKHHYAQYTVMCSVWKKILFPNQIAIKH